MRQSQKALRLAKSPVKRHWIGSHHLPFGEAKHLVKLHKEECNLLGPDTSHSPYLSACSYTRCRGLAWKKRPGSLNTVHKRGRRRKKEKAMTSFSNHTLAKEINPAPSKSLSVWPWVTQEKGRRKQIVCAWYLIESSCESHSIRSWTVLLFFVPATTCEFLW